MTFNSLNGLTTEIMDYENGKWVQMGNEHNYPFANERYDDNKIIWNQRVYITRYRAFLN